MHKLRIRFSVNQYKSMEVIIQILFHLWWEPKVYFCLFFELSLSVQDFFSWSQLLWLHLIFSLLLGLIAQPPPTLVLFKYWGSTWPPGRSVQIDRPDPAHIYHCFSGVNLYSHSKVLNQTLRAWLSFCSSAEVPGKPTENYYIFILYIDLLQHLTFRLY